MNRKRIISALLILLVCVSLLAGIVPHTEAASVSYVKNSSGYVYNWGARGEISTFLSPMAEDYYEENALTYAELAALSGSANQSAVPSSALYDALQTLMQDTHTSYTNYADTRPLYALTDCQQSNSGTLTCLYCAMEKSSKWDYGETWQREHTWPKSKSLNGNSSFDQYGYNDETDIMMLRPACPDCNMDRSNIAYGTSSSYFYPNLNDTIDVRGDVARTMLYGYVRWGNTGYMWGSSGVMQNVEVLLSWIEADPVDTWELGRNDAVESINGNRNVFVDYPELAFLLFGREVPQDMSTPSGSVACEHKDSYAVDAVVASCSQSGNTAGRYCNDCQRFYDGYRVIAPLEHSWKDVVCTGSRICTVCGYEEKKSDWSLVSAPQTATAYKLGIDKKDGQILYFNGKTESSSVNYRLAATTDINQAVDVYLETASGGYRLYFMNGSTKTYIRMYHYSGTSASSAKGSLGLVTSAPKEVMRFDAATKTLIYQYNSSISFYMGTYNDYTTFSCSNTSYITGSNASKVDVSQFPARFYESSVPTGHSYEKFLCGVCGHYDEQGLQEAADLNGDGKVTIFDAQILAEASAGRRQLTQDQWAAIGELTAADILSYVLGRYPAAQ